MKSLNGLAAGASLCALFAATPALAKAPTTAELAALVKAQAGEIAALKQRLSVVEARESQPAPSLAVAAPSAPTAAPAFTPEQAAQARTDAQVAAATQDTRSDELGALQARVAQLDARSQHGLKVDWSQGAPTLESNDGNFTFHPEGRIVADFSRTRGSSFGGGIDGRNLTGTEFRDLRLGAEGHVGKLGYDLEVDFAGNVVSVKEAYLTYETKMLGVNNRLYLGNSLNDRSIEGSTELVSLPFTERNAVASVAVPQVGYFGLGLQSRLSGKGWHVSAAVKGGDIGDNDGTHNDSVAYFVRAHVNPIHTKDAFIHLGGWGYTENLYTPTTINKTSAIASDFNDDVKVSASSIAGVTSDAGYGAEAGAGWHSLWAFAEYGQRTLRVPDAANVTQKAWSAYGGWFITGERPGYAARYGTFTRPDVLRPLNEGGPGAFEVLARYDKYDFTDTARGGQGHALTLGGNWYLNDFFDLKLNYIRWETNNIVGSYQGKDTGSTIVVRGEVSF